MRAIVLNEIPRDEKLALQWDDLVLQMEQPEVFYTYEWALAASSSLDAGAKPLLILIYETSLVGTAAFAITSSARNEVRFLGEKTADYCNFVSNPADRPGVVGAVFQELKRLGKSRVLLSNIPSGSATRSCLGEWARRGGYRVLAGGTDVYPQVILGDVKARDAMKQSLKQKKSVRNLHNALRRIGDIEVTHSKGGNGDHRHVTSFLEAHVARFLAAGRISPYVCSERRQFLFSLTELLSSKGWLTVSELKLNKKTIASHMGFEFAGKCFWYMPTFNMEYERFGPGTQLLKSYLERALDLRDIEVVDLGLGDEEYKKRFANSENRITQLVATSSAGQYARVSGRMLLVRALKRIPRVECQARRCAERLGSMSGRLRKEGISIAVRRILKKAARCLYSKDALTFFEWPDAQPEVQDARGASAVGLQSLDWAGLGKAVVHYEKDTETIAYLVRAGERLLKKKAQGFSLMTEDSVPVHFCWVSDFDGFFFEELMCTVATPRLNSAILFDCWTPARARGRGYYSTTLRLVSKQLSGAGKAPWISAAADNIPSVRGIEKAGFKPGFRVTNIKVLSQNVRHANSFGLPE